MIGSERPTLPPRVFLCHAAADAEFAGRLYARLATEQRYGRLFLLKLDALCQGPGVSRHAALNQQIEQAEVALLVLSVEFLADEEICGTILPALLARRARGALTVIPIVYRSCDWTQEQLLGELSPVPASGPALSARSPAEQARLLRDLINQIGSARRSPEVSQPWLLALLTLLLSGMMAAALVQGPRLVRGQTVALTVLLLAAFALLATGVGIAMLGTVGRLRTRRVWLGGGTALFLVTFASLFGGYWLIRQQGEAWIARGRILGLPLGRSARISSSDCRAPIEAGMGQFQLAIHGLCEQDPLPLIIQVDGYGEQEARVAKVEAQRGVTVKWLERAAQLRQLSGVVIGPDGTTVVPGAQVVLESCPESDLKAAADLYGRFTLGDLPDTCRTPPYQLRIYHDGRNITQPAETATGIIVYWH